jgi:hypothetical protein
MKEKHNKVKEILLEHLYLSPTKKNKKLNLSPPKRRRSYFKNFKTDLNMPLISINDRNINNIMTKEITTNITTKETERNIIKSLIITKVEINNEDNKCDKNKKKYKNKYSLTENNFYNNSKKKKTHKNKTKNFYAISGRNNKTKRACYLNDAQKLLLSLGTNSFNYLLTEDKKNFKNIKPSKDALESKHFVQIIKPFAIKPKQKFPRIYDPESLNYEKFEGLSKNVLNLNRELTDNLYKENEKTFSLPFCVIKKNKFVEKFQNPFVNKNLLEDGEKKEITVLPIERLSTIYFENFKNKIITNSKKVDLNISYLFLKFKKCILIACEQFKHLKINLNIFHKYYNLQNHPLNFPQTEELIKAIKIKDLNYSLYLLGNYYYCVIDFDLFWQTPLHWAAKRNLYKIIPKIIEYGGNVYQKDKQGNTPLHLAIKNGNIEAVLFLFIFLSSPVVRNDEKKRPIDYINENDLKMKNICEKAYLVYLRNQFQKYTIKCELIQVQFTSFVVIELKYDIDVEAYTLIKNMNEDFIENLNKRKKTEKYII